METNEFVLISYHFYDKDCGFVCYINNEHWIRITKDISFSRDAYELVYSLHNKDKLNPKFKCYLKEKVSLDNKIDITKLSQEFLELLIFRMFSQNEAPAQQA